MLSVKAADIFYKFGGKSGKMASRQKDIGYFERTGDMVFALERRKVGKKTKQCPVIRYR